MPVPKKKSATTKPRVGLVTERATLSMTGERLRIVIVADTHGAPHPKTVELVARERPDRILHAGDIGDLAVLDRLAKIAPTLAVRGNIDGQTPGLPDVLFIDVLDEDRVVFKILLVHIAVYGPKLRADVARLAREEGASLVACGHSHVPFLTRDRDLVVFNPGSIGPRRFHLPIVFGVLDLGRTEAALHHVDCETGERWLPKRTA